MYTGPPLDIFDSDMAQQNGVNSHLKNQPALLYLPEQPAEKEVNDILSVTKHGLLLSGSAASGKIGLLIGSYDLFESDGGFLFRVALPGVNNDETFKCEIQPNGTINIKGVTSTGEREVFAHNMLFEMHTQNLCPPGNFSISIRLPVNVDPSTLEYVLDYGVLEGVVNRDPVQGS